MRKISLLTICILLAIACVSAQTKSGDKPNVIIILADDLGYQDVGFNGCKDIPTPNIDQIAKGGVLFKNAYVSYAVCGPSRAGLITGRYQDRFGFGRNPLFAPHDINMGLPLEEKTIADILHGSGYHNMIIGKWHLGAHPALHPLKRGFDEFFGFLTGGHEYLPEKWILKNDSEVKSQFDAYRTRLLRGTQPVDEGEYLTEALSREAVSFIGRNANKPFFLYMAYNAPHTPLQATSKYLNRFATIKDPKRKTYAAMVSAMDDGVGSILRQLKDKGIEDNTIVVFLSDNGGPENGNASDNGPLRGQKSNYWDGGIKVPFAFKWPAKLKPGTVYDKPIISLDILATVAGYLNSKIDPKKPLDGVNLLPYLNGEKSTFPHDYLYWRNFDRKEVAVRSENYKMVVTEKFGNEIFDAPNDISEANNTIGKHKASFDQLLQQWKVWNKDLKDPKFFGLMEDDKYNKLNPDRFAQ